MDSPAAQGVMRRLARQLKDELFAVTGTKAVDLFGDPEEEIQVEIDPEKASTAGLSPAEIAHQLAQGDVKSAAGLLRGSDSELVVELDNEFSSLEDILATTISTGPAGETMKLSELASVRRSSVEPPSAKAIVNGRSAIVVAVLLRPEYRIDRWAKDAAHVVSAFRERLPNGIDLNNVMQQDRYVSDRMWKLATNLLVGVTAVSIVTFIFMGWRSSLLVTATLPLASLMVLSGMRFLEIPIHQMSITGLIIALGLLIDNAIIAADEIDLSMRRGLSPQKAVSDMVSRLFAPLLASTTTTALAFAPIALMEGPAGEFVGAIAVTVMLAIGSSFLLAMTVLPATAARLQTGLMQRCAAQQPEACHQSAERDSHLDLASREPFWQRLVHHGVKLPAVTRVYRQFLGAMLRRPILGVCVGCILPVVGFTLASQLREQFFPPADRDQFHVEVELQPSASMAQTQEVVEKLDDLLQEQSRIHGTAWFLGESAPPFYYNIISRRKNSPNYAHAIVTLDSQERATELIRELQPKVDRLVPEARVLVRQLEQGPPFDAPVEIRLFGSDLEQLRENGEQVRSLIASLPDVLHIRTALNEIRPVAKVNLQGTQHRWAGISEEAIANQLFARYEGLLAGKIIEEVEEIPVRVRVKGERRATLENVRETSLLVSMPIDDSSGQSNVNADSTPGRQINSPSVLQSVPISAIADVTLQPQRAVITRYNGRRVNEVKAYIPAGGLPSKVLTSFENAFEDAGMEFGPGYSIEYGGEASERDQAVQRLMANVSILAVGMVGALVLALASFRLAALIGVVAFLSIGLGLGALWLFGYPFGFMAIIGTMGLIGIAINDSIVVVAALRHNPLVMRGEIQATIDTVVEVTRHVLATTCTTIVGFLPLVLSGGGFWPPMAVAIGAGVIGATLISLTLVPCVFRMMSGNTAHL